nr:MAG TPA: hypothetical protein [Caudoviricetes sp.]
MRPLSQSILQGAGKRHNQAATAWLHLRAG